MGPRFWVFRRRQWRILPTPGAEVPFRVEGYGCTGPRCCDGLAAGVVDDVSVGEDAGDVRTGGG